MVLDTCLGALKNLDPGPSGRPHTIFAWFSRPPGKLCVGRGKKQIIPGIDRKLFCKILGTKTWELESLHVERALRHHVRQNKIQSYSGLFY